MPSTENWLDETRGNIKKTIDEARREIPRNTQAINDYQEHTLQASREIVDSYLESQKEIIQSLQSMWLPYIENTYGAFWNNWASPRRVAEIYARTVSNFADNIMTTTRITGNIIFTKIAYTNWNEESCLKKIKLRRKMIFSVLLIY